MIVLTLEDVICLVLLGIALLLFVCGIIGGLLTGIGEKILRRGTKEQEEGDE